MKIKNFHKKGLGIGAWKQTGLYVLMALAFFLIIYILLKVIIQRIKATYF